MKVLSLARLAGWAALVGGGLSGTVAGLLLLGPMLGFYDGGAHGPGPRTTGSVDLPAALVRPAAEISRRPAAIAAVTLADRTFTSFVPVTRASAPRRSVGAGTGTTKRGNGGGEEGRGGTVPVATPSPAPPPAQAATPAAPVASTPAASTTPATTTSRPSSRPTFSAASSNDAAAEETESPAVADEDADDRSGRWEARRAAWEAWRAARRETAAVTPEPVATTPVVADEDDGDDERDRSVWEHDRDDHGRGYEHSRHGWRDPRD